MPGSIRMEMRDGVALLRLAKGVTNAICPDLVEELSSAVRSVEEDDEAGALVLTGSNEKFFSIGFDIPRLLDLSRDGFAEFTRGYHDLGVRLFSMPKPTVAAIAGHAIAGGCLLTLSCDRRLLAAGRKLMGVNEIKLGVPIPYLGDRILRDLVGSRFAREIVETGEFFEPEDSLQMGLVDEVLAPGEVLPKAIELARALGTLPRDAFAAIKRDRTEPVLERVEARYAEKERIFLECWHSEETQARLREAAERF